MAAQQLDRIKVLVSGDVCGKFDQLFDQVSRLQNSKHGPFNILFCVGTFFDSDSSCATQLKSYIDGTRSVPISTYFIDKKEPDASWQPNICSKLQYLGTSGIRDIEGLKVAFLAGKDDFHSTTSLTKHCALLEESTKNKGFSGVDAFLTCVWPSGIDNNLTNALPITPTTVNSPFSRAIACLLRHLAPRYHFAGTENVFYQRLPYTNTPAYHHVTRFIALAAVANQNKARSLYACNMQPLATIKEHECPSNTTAFPYEQMKTSHPAPPSTDSSPPSKQRKVVVQTKSMFSYKLPTSQTDPFASSSSVIKPSAPPTTTSAVSNPTIHQYQNIKFVSSGTLQEPKSQEQTPTQMSERDQLRFSSHLSNIAYNRFETPSQSLPPGYLCKICKIPGHLIQNCPQKNSERKVPPAGYICFACHNPGHYRGDCPLANATVPSQRTNAAPTRTNCWFCLASPDVEAHMIMSIGTSCYLALAKGGLTPNHILIVPINHVERYADATHEILTETNRFKSALTKYFEEQSQTVVFFERDVPSKFTKHCHLQVVPLPKGLEPAILDKFIEEGSKINASFIRVNQDQVFETVGKSPYLLIEVNKQILVHVIDENPVVMMDFARGVLAGLLGRPQAKNWKNCQLDKEAETKQALDFKESFAKHDFTL